MTEPTCGICRQYVDMSQRHVEVDAETVAEDVPEEDYYVFHLACWDSLSAGWGRP